MTPPGAAGYFFTGLLGTGISATGACRGTVVHAASSVQGSQHFLDGEQLGGGQRRERAGRGHLGQRAGGHHIVGPLAQDIAVGVAECVPVAVQLAADGREDRFQRLAAVLRRVQQRLAQVSGVRVNRARYMLMAAPVLVAGDPTCLSALSCHAANRKRPLRRSGTAAPQTRHLVKGCAEAAGQQADLPDRPYIGPAKACTSIHAGGAHIGRARALRAALGSGQGLITQSDLGVRLLESLPNLVAGPIRRFETGSRCYGHAANGESERGTLRSKASLPGGADPKRTCRRSLSSAASPRRARNQRSLRSGRGVFRPCPGCEVGETLDLEA